MNFLSPWMLLGVLGAVIPVIVHLQGRRKAKVVPFAALEFLLGTDKRLAKKLVLRQIAALVARVAICLIVPLVLAQPYASCSRSGPLVDRGPQAVVLLIDNSMASGYLYEERTLLSRSLASARDILSQLGPEAEVVVITTTKANNDELSKDHANLGNVLNRLKVENTVADMRSALARAQQLLSDSNHKKNTVFVLALPTRSTLPTALTPATGVATRFISPVDKEVLLDNLAILDLQVQPNGSIGSRGVSVVAQVANYGAKPAIAHLRLQIGTTIVARGELSLGPGESQRKRFSANLVDEAHAAQIQVILDNDALVVDNARYVIADSADQVPVLLINGDPRTVRHEDELFYLEAALRPGDRSDSGTKITLGTADTLGEHNLESFDVIVLANVKPLSAKDVLALSQWVDEGGGLFVSMGDKVDPVIYNQRMGPLLAQELRAAFDLQSGGMKSEGSAQRLSKIETEHPIFSIFQKDAPGLYNASFTQMMLLGTTTDIKNRQVLARYTNGGAALIETRKGKGHLLLFTSSLDRDWNNLAIYPGFLPFVQGSVRYLASKPLQDRERQILVGESVKVNVGLTDTRLEIEGPEGVRIVLEGDAIKNRKHARVESLQTPGFYSVQSINAEGALDKRPESSFAVNINAQGSDLSQVSSQPLLSTSDAGGEEKAKPQLRRIELWHSIAAALLFLLLLESMISVYTGRSRKRAST